MKKVILIGAGPLLSLPDRHGSFLVCCDGGYRYLKDRGREPDLLVGDFDTFPKEEIGHPKEVISLNPRKDDTDSFFAVKELLKRGYREFHLYGLYGGRRDQTRASLNLLSYLCDRKAEGILYSEDRKEKRVRIDHQSLLLSPLSHGFVSVFSYSPISHGVTIKGRKYALSDKDLTSSTSLGCSNEFVGKEGRIMVKEGKLRIVRPGEVRFTHIEGKEQEQKNH